jgi:hypothetical protein
MHRQHYCHGDTEISKLSAAIVRLLQLACIQNEAVQACFQRT